MRALISDIHGNLDALRRVLDDLDGQGATEVVCLGDAVGETGDNPGVIALIAQRCEVVLQGNHDALALARYGPYAGDALDEPARQALAALEARGLVRDGTVTLVHGSPQLPLIGYLHPPQAREYAAGRMRPGEVVFCGHTHVQCLASGREARTGDQLQGWLTLHPEQPWVVGVGSVGAPEDHPGPCYVLHDRTGNRVRFRRLS